MCRTTIAPFESLGKKFRKTYPSNKSQSLNQVEGGWDEDGKGLSIWDVFTRINGTIKDGSSGDVACDSYHKYQEDVQLLANMGLNSYR